MSFKLDIGATHMDLEQYFKDHDVADVAKDIYVALPYVESMHPKHMEQLSFWQQAGMTIVPTQNSGGFIEITRAAIVADFLKSKCNSLLMLDEDVVFEREDAPLMLYAWNQPIVAGWTAIVNPHHGLCGNFCSNGEFPSVSRGVRLPPTGLAKVDWVGTGMMMIQRRVLTQIPETTEEYPFLIPNDIRQESAEKGYIHITEDQNFCRQAMWAGIDHIFVDLGVRGTHYKTQPMTYPQHLLTYDFDDSAKDMSTQELQTNSSFNVDGMGL